MGPLELIAGIFSANDLARGPEQNVAISYSLKLFGILVMSGLSFFLFGFLINTLTQIRDNTN